MSNIKTEVNGWVGIATLNRPEALNALNTALLNELADALEAIGVNGCRPGRAADSGGLLLQSIPLVPV